MEVKRNAKPTHRVVHRIDDGHRYCRRTQIAIDCNSDLEAELFIKEQFGI